MWRLSIISASFSHLIDTSSTLHFLLGYLVVSYLSIVSKQIFHHWQHVVCFWQHRVQLENENEKHVWITSVPWWEEEHQRGQRQKGWGRGYRDRERNEERWEEALNQLWNHQVQLYYNYNTHITLWHIFDIYIYNSLTPWLLYLLLVMQHLLQDGHLPGLHIGQPWPLLLLLCSETSHKSLHVSVCPHRPSTTTTRKCLQQKPMVCGNACQMYTMEHCSQKLSVTKNSV